jgi:dihydropteroate synthase
MIIGQKEFLKDHTYIMGILNVTPDSFYDGSRYDNISSAIKRAIQIKEEGADIIDIGGESTRPGYKMISSDEEIERVLPVIEAVKREVDLPVSLDTYKADVAREGIKAGTDLINDIWGLKYDENMAHVIADAKVACCLMHNRNNTEYTDFVNDTINDLMECINIAHNAGIEDDKIILDPGVGFAKDTEQNLEIIASLERINDMGYPVLLGVSRKSVVGNVLNIPKEERLAGTLALGAFGCLHKSMFLRVHDVKEHVQAVKMINEVIKYN